VYGNGEDGSVWGCAISRSHVADELKKAGRELGEDADDFASHSLRIGGATALHAMGVPDSVIMYRGNWAGPTYLRYCRPTDSEVWNVAELLASGNYRVERERGTASAGVGGLSYYVEL
jgi:hypothetical protein